MAEQVIFSKPYGTVLVDADVPCVIAQWHTFANTSEFISMQETILHYLETHSTLAQPWGLVGDVRQMGAIPDKVQQWLQDEFNPRLLAAGIRELNVVLATNIFGQLATQRYAHDTRQAARRAARPTILHTTFFNSLEAAKEGARQALAHR